jgi:hypothetical protein
VIWTGCSERSVDPDLNILTLDSEIPLVPPELSTTLSCFGQQWLPSENSIRTGTRSRGGGQSNFLTDINAVAQIIATRIIPRVVIPAMTYTYGPKH